MEDKLEMTIFESNDLPEITIRGVKFDGLCEYTAKDGSTLCVYGKQNSNEVVVELNNTNAIVGLFSTKPEEIGRLFDFIDKTRARKNWLVYFSSELNQYFKLGSRGDDQVNKAAYRPKNRLLDKVLSYFQNGLNKSFSDEIQAHTIKVDHVKLNNVYNDDPEYAESFDSNPFQKKSIAATSLPVGWNWGHFNDGSGSLHSPEGRSYFSYDEAPYHSAGGIEYQYDSHWNVFWGSMAEFKEYAESRIAAELLAEAGQVHREEPVNASQYTEADLKCGQRFFDKSLADSYDYVEHDEDGTPVPLAEQEWRRGFITIDRIYKDSFNGETTLDFPGGYMEVSKFLKNLNSGNIVPAPRLELEQHNLGSVEQGPDELEL